jgi:hypothetical protein
LSKLSRKKKFRAKLFVKENEEYFEIFCSENEIFEST